MGISYSVGVCNWAPRAVMTDMIRSMAAEVGENKQTCPHTTE